MSGSSAADLLGEGRAALDPREPPEGALDAGFFQQPVLDLAKALVGCVLVHRAGGVVTGGRIVETEAYRGPLDLAAHSAGGRRTKRTEAMFGAPGHAYMFLLYGSSWAFNIVAGPVDEPHAVLVRALEATIGLDAMLARRSRSSPKILPGSRELTNGPGKLCQAMGLDRGAYGASCASAALHLLPGPRGPVGRSARINIDYAGPWIDKPWRFYERGNAWVSVKPR
ncbi:MAG: DNA-3-methyladenine glycosylase [Polyangiaceae bacterium]